MTHLSDMEELLSSIIAREIMDYMREAMSCYMATAYRGCIVLSYIALFDDLLNRLEKLGKVNSKAKEIFIKANKKKSDQQVYESYLIDQLSNNKLISELDATFLETLRILRNKSAHPSGHKPSAEEARFIFSEVINRFLNKPIPATTQLVDEIILKLKGEYFFPTTYIEDIKTVVEEEITPLHAQAFPQLINKISNLYTDEDSLIKKNAGFFLTGLAKINDRKTNELLQNHLIKPKSADSDYEILLIRIISANGVLFRDLGPTVIKRYNKIISNRIENIKTNTVPTNFSHPVQFFSSLLSCVEEELLYKNFKDEFKSTVQDFYSTSTLIYSIKGKRRFKNLYLKTIFNIAGSTSFDIANLFSRALPDFEKDLSKILTDRQALKTILHILSASDWGAFGANDLKRAKFNPIPKLKEMANKYCTDKKTQPEILIKEILKEEIKISDFISEYF